MWEGWLDWWCCVSFDWISHVNIDQGILLPSCGVDWHVNCTLSSVIMKLRSHFWPLFWIILVELMTLKSKSVRLKNWLEITLLLLFGKATSTLVNRNQMFENFTFKRLKIFIRFFKKMLIVTICSLRELNLVKVSKKFFALISCFNNWYVICDNILKQ